MEEGRRRKLEKTDQKHHNLYAAPTIIKVTKPRRIRWAGYAWENKKCMYSHTINLTFNT
jgi:hypothetical protein